MLRSTDVKQYQNSAMYCLHLHWAKSIFWTEMLFRTIWTEILGFWWQSFHKSFAVFVGYDFNVVYLLMVDLIHDVKKISQNVPTINGLTRALSQGKLSWRRPNSQHLEKKLINYSEFQCRWLYENPKSLEKLRKKATIYWKLKNTKYQDTV